MILWFSFWLIIHHLFILSCNQNALSGVFCGAGIKFWECPSEQRETLFRWQQSLVIGEGNGNPHQ